MLTKLNHHYFESFHILVLNRPQLVGLKILKLVLKKYLNGPFIFTFGCKNPGILTAIATVKGCNLWRENEYHFYVC